MGGTLSIAKHSYLQCFNIPEPPLTEKNLPDQAGKVFIVTGANTGVGYEVSRILYSRNGTVYLGCRNANKAQTAIDKIKTAHPNSTGRLVYLHLNLSDLTTIKSTVDEFLAKEARLDWLNNNAGVMVPPSRMRTTQNHELQIGTNILGPFLLTKLLVPILKSTAASSPSSARGSVRVSWAASVAVDGFAPRGGCAFDTSGNLNAYTADQAYAVSKAANWFLAHEFAQRAGGTRDGVMHTCYNPGNLTSELARHLPEFWLGGAVRWVLYQCITYPSVMGAYTEIYSGLSRDLTLERDQAAYIVPWGQRRAWNREDLLAEMGEGRNSQKLWEWCDRETRQYA